MVRPTVGPVSGASRRARTMIEDTTHPHDPDEVECRDCGKLFDLARQTYYTDKCPDCVDDKQS